MPLKNGRMTNQEKVFIGALAETSDKIFAARQAGYAYPESTACNLVNKQSLMVEVHRIQQERLDSELLPAAINALHRLLTDTRTPSGAVVQAAKVVLDRTLGVQNPESSKGVHEMTGDELARQLDRLRHEAAARSGKIIDAVVIPNQDDSKSVFD